MCWTCFDLEHPTKRNDDAMLLQRLMANQLTRNETRQAKDRLWLYAWQVIPGLIYDGKLASVRLKHPHRVPTEEEMRILQGNQELRQSLVADAIADSLPGFLTALASGRSWRPDGGASITTYWTNRVVSSLHKKIGSWANDQHRRLHMAVRSDPFEYAEPPTTTIDHETRLAQRAALRKIIPQNIGDAKARAIARETRAVAALYLAGNTRADAAKALGITGARVDYLIRRMKSTGNMLVQAGEIDRDLIPGTSPSLANHGTARSGAASKAGLQLNDIRSAQGDPWSVL